MRIALMALQRTLVGGGEAAEAEAVDAGLPRLVRIRSAQARYCRSLASPHACVAVPAQSTTARGTGGLGRPAGWWICRHGQYRSRKSASHGIA